MKNLATLQALFGKTITDIKHEAPSSSLQQALKVNSTKDAVERLNVYKNNFYSSLIDVLSDKFPLSLRVVGEKYFKAAAKQYITENPPQSAVMIDYADNFPEFINRAAREHNIEYLGDLAAVEWSQHTAYYCADAPFISAQEFSQCDIAVLTQSTLQLAPSLTVRSSQFAIYDIWEMLTREKISTVQSAQPQSIAVFRQGFNVCTVETTGTMHFFLEQLGAGCPVGLALEHALERDQDGSFLPADAIHFLISSELVSKIILPEEFTP